MPDLKFSPKAILFDMDGVIVDSMPYHFIAWYEALLDYGVRVSCFDVFLREGENWRKSLRDILSASGITPTEEMLENIFTLRGKIFKKYFKLFIFQDAVDMINILKAKGYPLALVTGTPKDSVVKILPQHILKQFDVVIGGDCVKRGKPYPDPYRAAAKALGLRARDCFVIENAPLGILSAKRAGMFVAAITTSLPKEYLYRSDLVVKNIRELKPFI